MSTMTDPAAIVAPAPSKHGRYHVYAYPTFRQLRALRLAAFLAVRDLAKRRRTEARTVRIPKWPASLEDARFAAMDRRPNPKTGAAGPLRPLPTALGALVAAAFDVGRKSTDDPAKLPPLPMPVSQIETLATDPAIVARLDRHYAHLAKLLGRDAGSQPFRNWPL